MALKQIGSVYIEDFFLPVIINDDFSGLNSEDIQLIKERFPYIGELAPKGYLDIDPVLTHGYITGNKNNCHLVNVFETIPV